jgi:hypothetical protein
MSANVNENVAEEQEVVQPTEAEGTEASQAETQKTQSQEDLKRKNDQEYNWAEARRKQRELEQRLKEQEELIKRFQSPKKEEDEIGLEDDALVEGKHIRKLKKEIEALKAQQQEREQNAFKELLEVKYPDFESVVSSENIETLKQTEPDIAEYLASVKDPHKQAREAYKWMKKLGIGTQQKEPMEKKKAIENSQKPISVNAATKTSAIGNVHHFENGLTPELKKNLWKDMQECIKRA